MERNWHLIAVKRERIPEWLYGLIVCSFLRPLAVRQPLRWMLHRELEK